MYDENVGSEMGMSVYKSVNAGRSANSICSMLPRYFVSKTITDLLRS